MIGGNKVATDALHDNSRKPQRSSNNHTTFFFSNFPNKFGEHNMIKIFQRWARVKEVFISRRLNGWERRFGFMRLFEGETWGD